MFIVLNDKEREKKEMCFIVLNDRERERKKYFLLF